MCIGLGILRHGHDGSAYPRWLDFFNVWCSIGMVTSSFIPFFHDGPFTWSGLVGFWIPVWIFGGWNGTMCWMTFKAIAREDAQEPCADALSS